MKRYAVSPVADGCAIKKGQRFLITKWRAQNDDTNYDSFDIMLEFNDGTTMSIYCLANTECAHIDNQIWTIIEEEEPFDDH